MCAQTYGWTPQQVDEMDPDFMVELRAFWAAQSNVKRREKARAALRSKAGR